MGDLGKGIGKMFGVIAKADPIANKVYSNNKDSDLVKFLYPARATSDRIAQGDSLGESLGDPGAYFTQTTPEKKAAAAEAEQERLNATPPTITSASIAARQQADRLKRRKGVLANIYGGGKSSSASVGTKTLLGS